MAAIELPSARSASLPSRAILSPLEIVVVTAVSVLMVTATSWGWWSLGWMEVIGFVTGGISVWLTVREHLWLWPIGLANNVVFFALFWHGRLYADAVLQIVYFGLGVYGWWNWLHGGVNRTELWVSRTRPWECIAVALFIPFATFGVRKVLVSMQGAAPLWDALTTVLSLAAQYLLCRKRLEHWFIWMAADVIYVPLYFSRSIPLIGILYFVFFLMCIVGLAQWQRRYRLARAASAA
jgi:nicotinamide mononucleotide transporter